MPSVALGDTVSSMGTVGSTVARVPLTFAPSFSNETNYVSNLVYFTVYLTGTTYMPNGHNIVSLGLVNAANPSNAVGDKLFSRIAFSPVTYDSSHGLAITWGITLRAA